MLGKLGVFLLVLGGGAACGGGGDDAPPGDDGPSSDDAYQLCVDRTNELRATVGRPPLERSAALEAFANEGAEYDHTREPHDHFRDFSGEGIAFAENECPHWDLAFGGGTVEGLVLACLDAFWSEGPGGGHYDNMVGAYGTLGCGIYNAGSDFTIIQDFGR